EVMRLFFLQDTIKDSRNGAKDKSEMSAKQETGAYDSSADLSFKSVRKLWTFSRSELERCWLAFTPVRPICRCDDAGGYWPCDLSSCRSSADGTRRDPSATIANKIKIVTPAAIMSGSLIGST